MIGTTVARFCLVAVVKERWYIEHHGLMQFLSKPEQNRWYRAATIRYFL